MSRGPKGDAAGKVIRLRPRAKRHGQHHSSGWKIALADFMTAMLALFIVLWIQGMDQPTRESIAAYFSDPVGVKNGYSSGASPISAGTSPAQVRTVPLAVVMRMQQERMREVGQRIREQLNREEGLGRVGAQVEIVASKDGLRIELLEAGGGETFFPFGSAAMKPVTRDALEVIAAELRTLPNPMIMEGHTDAAPFGSRTGYSNWELSSDRAHAARRVLEANGIGSDRILEVRALADKHLRVEANPLDPSNRRITILLPLILPEAAPLDHGESATTL